MNKYHSVRVYTSVPSKDVVVECDCGKMIRLESNSETFSVEEDGKLLMAFVHKKKGGKK